MRLAAINTTASPFHAPASLMLDVVRGFVDAAEDNRAMVLYGRGDHDPIPGVMFDRPCSRQSVINHYLWSRTLDREGLMSRRATTHMVEYLKEFRPDIIHLHNLHGHYLHYPTLFSGLERMDVPVVITLHDLWLLTGRCCFPDTCQLWKQRCRHCPDRSKYPPTLVSHCKINHLLKSDCVNHLPEVTLVAPSQWCARHVRESNLRLCPTVVIPNGVDPIIFHQTATAEKGSESSTVILAVANKWEARKRPDIIAGIAERLNDNERLIILGDTNGMPTGLKNSTYIPNITDYEELVRLYNSADCTISASTNETYGMTIAESMACGVPVIVPTESAMAEYVTSTDGITVAQPTADAFIKAIRNISGNHDKLSPHAPYRRQDAVSEYIRLFDTLVKESH